MFEIGEVLTSVVKEEATFKWEIKNFSKIICTPEFFNPSMEIELGMGIRSPSKWKLEFTVEGIHAYLDLQSIEFGSRLNSICVKCVATIKGRDGCDLVSTEVTSSTGKRCFNYPLQILKETVLVGDLLVIHLKLEMSANNLEKAASTIQVWEYCRSTLDTLLETGFNSDVVIHAKDSNGKLVEMKAHKRILGAKSSVFQKMFESTMTEALTGSVLIQDLSPECIKIMINWIYTGVLDEDWKKVPDDMIIAACKYDLPNLRCFLDKQLHLVCTMDTAVELRKLAKLHGLGIASKNLYDYIRANLD